MCSCLNASIRHQQVSLGNQPQGWPSWTFVTDKVWSSLLPEGWSQPNSHQPNSAVNGRVHMFREPFTHPFSLLVYAFVPKTCREDLPQ